MTVSVLTGATRGIGLEVARQLAGLGHTVFLGAPDLAKGQEVAQTLPAGGLEAVPLGAPFPTASPPWPVASRRLRAPGTAGPIPW